MSYIICGDCTTNSTKRYDDGVCAPVTKLHGSLRALFVKCGTIFTDLFDTAALGEWETKLTAVAPTVFVTPSYGKFSHDEGSASILENFGASLDVPDLTEYTFTFQTITTAANYDAVEDWYNNLFKDHASLRLNWFDYEGDRLYTDDGTVELFRPGGVTATAPLATTDAIGYVFSINKAPVFVQGPNGFGRAGMWKIEGKFSSKHVLRSIEIPGIKAIVDANG